MVHTEIKAVEIKVRTELRSLQIKLSSETNIDVEVKLYRAEGFDDDHEIICFCPGFGDTIPYAYDDFCATFAASSKATICFVIFPITIGDMKVEVTDHTNVSMHQLAKAVLVREIAKTLSPQRISFLGYSEGVCSALIAAALLMGNGMQGRIGDFFLLCPPSLTGKEPFTKIISRGGKKQKQLKALLKEAKGEALRRMLVHNASIKRWIFSRGMYKALITIWRSASPGRMELLPLLLDFAHKAQRRIVLVAGVSDPMTSCDLLQDVATRNKLELRTYEGPHDEIFRDPEDMVRLLYRK